MYDHTDVLAVPDVSAFDSARVHKQAVAREYEISRSNYNKKEHSFMESVAIASDHITFLTFKSQVLMKYNLTSL